VLRGKLKNVIKHKSCNYVKGLRSWAHFATRIAKLQVDGLCKVFEVVNADVKLKHWKNENANGALLFRQLLRDSIVYFALNHLHLRKLHRQCPLGNA
jgi:hypothetical protein